MQGVRAEWGRGGRGRQLLELSLLALCVTGIWYLLYFLLAPWIWRQNIPVNPEEITPWVRTSIQEYDGVELYALYILVFACLAGTFALSRRLEWEGERHPPRLLLPLLAAGALGYCVAVGFVPPLNTLRETPLLLAIWQAFVVSLAVLPLVALLYYLQRRFPRLLVPAAALVLLPGCFLAISSIGWTDYTYILAPAQRVLDGARWSDIYFQYDLLPSLLAAAWMKLDFDLVSFRVLGQAAYFLGIMAVFLLSRRLFRNQGLSVFLLAALILGRLYATPMDVTLVFQVTPIRLDLWIPLLLVVYRWGAFHWSVGLVCALLLVFARNFGVIYSAACLQLMLTLCALDYFGPDREQSAPDALAGYLRRCAPPLLLMVAGVVAGHLLLHNAQFGDYTGYYRKIGIGFLQIARSSFYWYIPPVFALAAVLLYRLRGALPANYLQTGFLLIFCAIGNSLYFFGRSHEHNILNLAIVLIFVFFLMLDLADRYFDPAGPGDRARSATWSLRGSEWAALALILGTIVCYANNIGKRGEVQLENLLNEKPTYHALILPEGFGDYMRKIREVTRNSSKVFFADEADFTFYHFGKYAQVGYCNPILTWIFTKDLHSFLQKLLDNGYYLVFSPKLRTLMTGLQFGYRTTVGDTTVVARQAATP